MKQFPDLGLRGRKCAPPLRRRAIHLAQRFPVPQLARSQIPLLLEIVQQRIQRPGTDPVPVAREFFRHPQAEDRLLHSVMQHVQTDRARVQVAVIELRFRHPISMLTIVRYARAGYRRFSLNHWMVRTRTSRWFFGSWNEWPSFG